ncbi:SRPBCC family protein [Acidithiobacillus ferriphilus]|uniref:SRPBCC family protein n=1 Tax=Acidithiobacillus ferriphilus TaxID=1689834 RepID=UPI00231ADE43|nr:SRPBCC family protein [Acidithiobacillus sp.]
MPIYQVTQRINAPADVVWKHLSNILAWPEWLPTVTAVSPLEGKTCQIGAKFKVIQPKLRPAIWQVTKLEPGQCFIWESTSPGIQLWASHTVRIIGSEESGVELQFRFSGTLGVFLGWIAGSITRKYITTEASSLKVLAESNAHDEAFFQSDSRLTSGHGSLTSGRWTGDSP